MKRSLNFDIVRGVAICFVFLSHLPVLGLYDISFLVQRSIRRADIGYLGVELFFVLSGYLITNSLLSTRKTSSLGGYFKKRIIRVVPAYFILLALLYVINPNYNYLRLILFIDNYFYVSNVRALPSEHLWSLCIEMQFYVLWGILFFWIQSEVLLKKTILLLIPVSIVFCIAVAVKYDSFYTDKIIFSNIVARITPFCIGTLMCFATNMNNKTSRLLNQKALFFILIAGFAFETILPDIFSGKTLLLGKHFVLTGVAATAFYFFLKMKELKAWKFIGYIGIRSYSIYLIHYPILVILISAFNLGLGIASIDVLPYSVIASAIGGILLFKAAEEPFLYKKTSIIHPKSEKVQLQND